MSEQPQIDSDSLDPRMVEQMVQRGIPFCGALGVRVVEVKRSHVTMALPYKADLVGDPVSGVLHGGAVTALIDTVCGMAVFTALQKLIAIATLDLRIDYLKPAVAEKELCATAECYKMTRSIAFVRARAYHAETPDDLIASCVGTFMIGSSDKMPMAGAPAGGPAGGAAS